MEPFVTWAAIFQRVEPSVAAALGQRLRSMDYLPGQVIFAEGEPGDRLYAIAAGKVKTARRSPNSRQNLQTVLGPSDILVNCRLSTRARGRQTRPPSPMFV